MDEAHLTSLRGAEALRSNEVAPRGLLAHGAHDVGADGGRQQAQARFAQAEVHALSRHQHVAARGQTHAAGIAVAVQPPHHRQRAAVDGPQHLRQAGGVGAVVFPAVAGHGLHPVQVSPRTEGLAMSAQHDDPHAWVLPQAAEGLGQLRDHAVIEGVADLGTVEEDLGDTAFDADVQGVHACFPALYEPSRTGDPLRSCPPASA